MRNQKKEINETSKRRRLLASTGLGFGPALYGIGEFVHHQMPTMPLLAAALSLLGLYVWIGGILGLVHLLRPAADRIGLLSGAAALLGLLAVSNIMIIQLVFALIDQKVQTYPALIGDIFDQVLFVTYLFGPVFPGALAVMSGAILWHRVLRHWSVWAFLLGAITFPAGRVGSMPWLIHASDFVLAIGGLGMAWCIWNRSKLWNENQSPQIHLD